MHLLRGDGNYFEALESSIFSPPGIVIGERKRSSRPQSWSGSWLAWNLRETLATVLAFQDLYFSPPDTNLYLQFYQGG